MGSININIDFKNEIEGSKIIPGWWAISHVYKDNEGDITFHIYKMSGPGFHKTTIKMWMLQYLIDSKQAEVINK